MADEQTPEPEAQPEASPEAPTEAPAEEASAVEPEDETSAEAPSADASENADHPPHFFSRWHYDAWLRDIANGIVAIERRREELKAMNAHPDQIEQTERELEFAKAQLAQWGHWGQAGAEKR